MKLVGFDFVVEYNLGRSNLVADALSFVHHGVIELGSLLSSNGINWALLQEEVNKDSTLTRIRDAVLKGEPVPLGFSIDHDRLFYKGRYVLARSSPFISVLLREYHDSPLGRHAGELKTYLRLAAEWYWEECVEKLPTTSGSVTFSKRPKLPIKVRQGYYKIFQFYPMYRNMSLWIS